jgi:hypothetical protein
LGGAGPSHTRLETKAEELGNKKKKGRSSFHLPGATQPSKASLSPGLLGAERPLFPFSPSRGS